MEAGVASIEQQTGKKFGDLKNPLLVSVRSGARDSMPGMMDTILNLGLNDQTVEALAKKTGNAALRLGLLPPLRPDVRRRRPRRAEARRRGSRSVRDGDSRPQARALSPGHRRHQADRRRSQGAGRPLQGAGQGTRRQAVPELPVGSAARRRRRGLRLVDERSRDRLPPQVQHPDRVGHRRQRPGDGLRQHRRHLGFRRRVHAQPGERRQGVLRRVPDQRAGRGRRRRRAHAGAGGRAEEADAEGLRRARAHPPDAREALQGRAGLRVHHRGRRRLHAADAQRQAHRDGGAEVLGGHVQGEADRLEDGGDAQSRRPARTAAGAGVRRVGSGQGEGDRDRTAGRPGRGLRPDLPQCRSRRDGGREGREGPARPRRDLAGGSARHDRGRRHPHGARRRVVARGARRPADGQGLRLRRGGGRSRLPGAHGDGRRPDVQGRRLDVDRRHGRQGLRRPGQDRAVGDRRRPDQRRQDGAAEREVQALPRS